MRSLCFFVSIATLAVQLGCSDEAGSAANDPGGGGIGGGGGSMTGGTGGNAGGAAASAAGGAGGVGAGGSGSSGGSGGASGASDKDGGMPVGGASGAGSLVPIASMSQAYVAIADDGALALWNSAHALPAEAELLRFTAVAIGGPSFDNVLCGITRDGPTRCFDLDDASAPDRSPPTDRRFEALAANTDSVCGLLESGALDCFTGAIAHAPPGRYTALSGRDASPFCAVRDDGELTCFPNYNVPLNAPPAGPFISVAVDLHAACAIRTDHSAVCWRWFDTPMQVELDGAWRQLAINTELSGNIACGVRMDGSLECLGLLGTVLPTSPEATPPSGAFEAVALTRLGGACAVRADGSVSCWTMLSGGAPTFPPDGLKVLLP
jgi:hypothetical protein